jgi:hypothetical protein
MRPIWTVIVVKNHSDMRSDGSSYRNSYRNLAGMSVRDFLRYEYRYQFISESVSVFLVCSVNLPKYGESEKYLTLTLLNMVMGKIC